MPRDATADRVAKEALYDEYKRLLSLVGVSAEWSRWQAHRRELKADYVAGLDGYSRRLTREELFAWWRERFTDDEIYRMAAGL